nr:MAG TPA: hypothetical protein [Caudoviricetes sp.]
MGEIEQTVTGEGGLKDNGLARYSPCNRGLI